MRWVVLLILFLPLGICIDVEFSCPEEAVYNSEFVCNVNVVNVSEVYDLKIYIRGNGSGINRVWDGVDWQRSDWYVKDFINEDGDYGMRVIIHKEFDGDANGEIKLRKSGTSNIIFEDNFGIKIIGSYEGEDVVEILKENVDGNVESKNKEDGEEPIVDVKKRSVKVEETGMIVNHIKKEAPKKVINLNSQDDNREVQVVYESKNERIKNYMVYGFIFLLICIIGILLYEKKW